ncbi:MAG TPA: carbohydrate ABC transporter permease [Aggregatilineales bacterium]|nr:carbohydrate ABC transporter permease [Anaerolineales bacterium]HRE46526.1 carbohydrate ABC transporter permease [Aggregatilineales bacterium]
MVTLTRRGKTVKWIIAALLCIPMLLYLIPYMWVVSTSFKPDGELHSGQFFPSNPSFIQYERLLFGQKVGNVELKIDYPRYYLNSIFVAGVSLLLVTTLDSLAAFAFAKFKFRGRTILFWTMLATMMLPIYATLIPSFYMFSRVYGWLDRYEALIIPGIIDAYGIFLLTQYMRGIPNELLDSARIDGAGPLRTFWYIVVPLSRPAIGTLLVIKFLGIWNEYLWPLLMIRKPEMFTLPLGIAQMQVRQGAVVEGIQMAGAALATIPAIFLVFLIQRQFLRGMTAGAVKA